MQFQTQSTFALLTFDYPNFKVAGKLQLSSNLQNVSITKYYLSPELPPGSKLVLVYHNRTTPRVYLALISPSIHDDHGPSYSAHHKPFFLFFTLRKSTHK